MSRIVGFTIFSSLPCRWGWCSLDRTLQLGSLALAGCGVNGHRNASPAGNTTSQVSRTGKHQTAEKVAAPSLTTLNPAWIMPNRLPMSGPNKERARHWPMYNTQLAMNLFPASWHGNGLISTWKLSPKWGPYLMKNEKIAPLSAHSSLPLTLYITLQGTVFLYPQTLSANQ